MVIRQSCYVREQAEDEQSVAVVFTPQSKNALSQARFLVGTDSGPTGSLPAVDHHNPAHVKADGVPGDRWVGDRSV